MADRVSVVISEAVSPAESGVGLCLDNGLAMVACQLGALWAGHHFVPLALDLPAIQLHMRELLERSNIRLVFCPPSLTATVRAVAERCGHQVTVHTIDDNELTDSATARYCMKAVGSAADRHCSEAVGTRSALAPSLPGHRFCTFHTSGTTGAPKPVHSTYAEFEAFVRASSTPYRLSSTSRVFVATSAVFDPSAGVSDYSH